MARPIKRLHGELDVVKELRRRSRSTIIGVRDRERAEIVLLRLDGVGVEAVAELREFGAAHLVEERFEAASREDLQTLE